MGDRVTLKDPYQSCTELLRPYPWTSEYHKEGHYKALEDYQMIYVLANRDLKKLEFSKRILNNRRIWHYQNLFSKGITQNEQDFSRGFVMGLSAVRMNGIFTSPNNSRNTFYDNCLKLIEEGKLKIEDIKNEVKTK